MNKLAEWMQATGTSDEDLAKLAGTSRVTISRLRRGKMVPSLSMAAAIKVATKGTVTPDDFLVNLLAEDAA